MYEQQNKAVYGYEHKEMYYTYTFCEYLNQILL